MGESPYFLKMTPTAEQISAMKYTYKVDNFMYTYSENEWGQLYCHCLQNFVEPIFEKTSEFFEYYNSKQFNLFAFFVNEIYCDRIRKSDMKSLCRDLIIDKLSKEALLEKYKKVEISNDILVQTVDKILSENSVIVNEFKSGKPQSLNVLMGKCMKILKGRCDPSSVKTLLESKLK